MKNTHDTTTALQMWKVEPVTELKV